ncbi:transcription termination/antitermination protein NusG [bacterium]|nr:transcription termination/antitermination protein NusG [bacterium]MBU1025669.1 transcription termination/antitermination protein NusG [bacterium]
MAWYIAHTKSGAEKKVSKAILRQVEIQGFKHLIFNILVPEEERLEVVKNQRRPVKHKVYPGYVFVEMELTDETWALVRNTEGVTHFVGASEKHRPVPVKESEIQTILKRMGMDTGLPQIDLDAGNNVRVLIGPFADFTGVIQEIDLEKQKAKVLLSVFGRDTPVEFDFNQIEKSSDE